MNFGCGEGRDERVPSVIQLLILLDEEVDQTDLSEYQISSGVNKLYIIVSREMHC